MKRKVIIILGLIVSFTFGFYVNSFVQSEKTELSNVPFKETTNDLISDDTPSLGAFSISLSVKDLKTSKLYYEALGFSSIGGSMKQNYLIMKNGNALIGIFQDMFEGNILTFNPGWNHNAENVDPFDDVRKIQEQLKSKNIKIDTQVDEKSSGPGSLMFTDPDGNIILIDQHR